ncbi:uncharacterized protein LOC111273655 isoform X2 [Varroa jacobsoni]|uniref:uncharacterized protein LOC111273655 isoform X2 n=1 Tax=Varroa jacobsoni TaxID=62625 RepID=UPI000BF39723|nr:uncharacterized protein LOC111273655 isoform X2 [Varroa jacobsoni]
MLFLSLHVVFIANALVTQTKVTERGEAIPLPAKTTDAASNAVASFGNEPNLSVDFPQLNATVLSAGIPIVQLLNRKLNSTTARPERKFPSKVFTNVKSSDFPDVFFSSDGFEDQPKSSQEVVKKSDRFTLTRAANYDEEHPLNQLLDIGLHLNNFIDVIVSFYRDPAAFLRISIPYIIWWLAKRFDLKSIVAGHVTKHLKRWLTVLSPAVGETS